MPTFKDLAFPNLSLASTDSSADLRNEELVCEILPISDSENLGTRSSSCETSNECISFPVVGKPLSEDKNERKEKPGRGRFFQVQV